MLRLRQVALVAKNLASAEAELGDLLDEAVCFRDPGVGEFGLDNALFAVGDRFLEIVSPNQEGTTAGRLLEKRGGDGGYMVLLQTDDLAGFRSRARRDDVREIHEALGEGIHGIHVHPRDVGGAILSVDETDDPAAWGWAGFDWPQRTPSNVVSDLTSVTVQVDDPAATAGRWAALLDRRVDGADTVSVDDGEIRFVAVDDGRGPGVKAIDLVACDRGAVGRQQRVLGVDFRLV